MWPFKRIPTHLEFMKARAAEGDTSALWELAYIYLDGKGVPKSESAWFQYLRQAGELGSALASYSVAARYLHKEMFDDGLKWMRQAAEQGLGQAQFTLGFIYSLGKICRKDIIEACIWLRVAGSEGSSLESEARKDLEKHFQNLFCVLTADQKHEVLNLSDALLARLPKVSFDEHRAKIDAYENPE